MIVTSNTKATSNSGGDNLMIKKFLSLLLAFTLFTQCNSILFGNQLSLMSTFAEETSPDIEPPTAPASLILVSKTSDTVTVSWTSSTDNVSVLEYDVYRNGAKVGTTNDVTFTDENLAPEETYSYFVKAKDSAGNESVQSNTLDVTTDTNIDDPQIINSTGASMNLTFVEKTDSTITLQWDDPQISDIAEYNIINNGTIVIESVTDTACTLAELSSGTDYELSITAVDNEGGILATSNVLAVKTLLSPPSNISVVCKTTQIILLWDELEGSSGYEISVDEIITQIGNNASFVHSGLQSNTGHTYQIRGIGSNGEAGTWSQVISATTAKLAVPSDVQTSQTFTSISIVWGSVDEAEEYEIEADDIIISNLLETSYIHKGLAFNTPHTYRVRAKNSGGYSEWSELKTVRTTSYGTGTPGDPYIITNKEKLLNVKNDLAASYKLGSDIDLGRGAWEPVGNQSAPFTGTFDGNGYTISNLEINKPDRDYVGFFGYTNNAILRNIKIENVSIAGKQYTGILAGSSMGNGIVQNCSASGSSSVTGTQFVGGLIGYSGSTVEKCSSNANVTATNRVGGLIGLMSNTVSLSYATGNVSGTESYIGGLVGWCSSANSRITKSYATGEVAGLDCIGGLVGLFEVSGGLIENCFSLGNIAATNTNYRQIGGLAGDCTTSTIRNCYVSGYFDGGNSSYAGGIIGRENSVTITNSYYDGIVARYVPKKASDYSKLTSGLKAQASFSNWDFSNIWAIDEGVSYPYLRELLKPQKVNENLPSNDVAGGIGTLSDPYIITTKEQLNNLKNDLTGYYKLGANIDLYGTEWESVGNTGIPFTGAFDGNGYTISNLTINKSTVDYIGFFGYMSNVTIKNLTLRDVTITGKQYTGGITGYTAGTSVIQNCAIKGASSVTGTANVGGLIGQAIGTVDRCSSEADVTLTGTGSYCGGLIGNCGANVYKSYATGDITSGGVYVGGLLGYLNGTSITECYSTGNITGGDRVGGLLGHLAGTGATASNCFSSGSVTAPANKYAGGLVGYFASGTVRYCYSTGIINGSGSYVGGLIGRASGTVTSSYFDSTIAGITTPTAQAKSTEQLKQQATYTSWNFIEVWNLIEDISYPTLMSIASTAYIPVPTGLKQESVTDDIIMLSWHGISDALSYDIEVDGNVVNTGLDTQYIHSNLMPGTNHTYRVRQNSVLGQSVWSSALTVCTALTVPQNITATPDVTSIVLSWDAVGEAEYETEVDGIIVNNGTATIYTHSDVLPDTEHKYRVRSKNEYTMSAWSNQVISTTLSDTYPYPKNLRATPAETSILIEWDAAEGATGYEISADGVVSNTYLTSFNHTDLELNSQHEYKIRALYPDGISAWSPILCAKTLSDMPGLGTEDDPFIIKTVDTLKKVKNNLAACYKLGNDIDLQNEEWTPIGVNSTVPFIGTFDGDGYTISNLKISKPTMDYIGLFGYIGNASIKKLNISDININGRNYVGSIAGKTGAAGIENCSVKGSGTVTGAQYVGGLVGESNGTIVSCSSSINVSSTGQYIGGLAGFQSGIMTNKSYATGNVSSTSSYVGGLIGYFGYINAVTITECYATGNVNGASVVGGLIGYTANGSSVTNCYSLGNVTSTSGSSGGLIGQAYTTAVRYCYSAGEITVNGTNMGGLVGLVGNGTTVTSSFYDGLASSFIPVKAVDISKLTTGMKWKTTFVGWDFIGIWNIDEGSTYPYLRNVSKPSEVSEGLPLNDVAGGKGTAAEPYMISTKEQMNNIKYDITGNYKLANDIDLQNEEWTPIGVNSTVPFIGTFDGDGYTIRNLKINLPTVSNVGLFGYVKNATIKNVVIDNINVKGSSNIGALIGTTEGISTVENCSITGTGIVNGASCVGGVIGNALGGLVIECSSTATVTGSAGSVGGLIGNSFAAVSKCYSTGNVSTTGSNVGGLIGNASNNSVIVIMECYATGNVTGGSIIGGLIGFYNATGSLTGNINNCYALGNVTATITSSPFIGGLIGYVYCGNAPIIKVNNCYSSGSVNAGTATSYIGGLVGYINGVTITNCYFNSTTTGRTTPDTQARTTSQLMQQATFTGWDFANTWNIDEGTSYPYLMLVQAPIGLIATNTTENRIDLAWRSVSGAISYDIEVDGMVVNTGLNTSYTHNELQPGTEHTYRVRAVTSSIPGPWSNTLTVLTLFPGQISLSLSITENAITVTWNPVDGAASYDIEVDGSVINTGLDTTYIHLLSIPNVQHTYRVRAKANSAATAWSSMAYGINWSQSNPGICIAQTSWPDDINQNVEVTIKANNITDMYASYIVLQFDPQILEPDTQSITNLVWPDGPDVYTKYAVYWETGKVKLLVSKKGGTQGITGQFDVVKLNFIVKENVTSQITGNLVRLVNSSGEYININEVYPLEIHISE